jgi:hypothetical protein
MNVITTISFGCYNSPWKELLPSGLKLVTDADEHLGPHDVRYINRIDRVTEVLSQLEAMGLVDDLHGPYSRQVRLHVTRTRLWTPEEHNSAEYSRVSVKWVYLVSEILGADISSLDGDPRMALEFTDARRPKRPWMCSSMNDSNSILVRRDGLERMQRAPFSDFELLPTRQYVNVPRDMSDPYQAPDASHFSIRQPKPQHEWWQFYPRLELPRMHASVVRKPLNSFPHAGTIERGPGHFLNGDEGCDDFQCVWSRRVLEAVGPFDCARTWETQYQPPRGAMMIFSQRAVRYLREVAGDILFFVPVRIVEE